MENKIQEGEIMEFANAGSAILSGAVVPLGDRIAIACQNIAATSGSGSVALTGVYQLAAIDSAAFVQGEQLFWDASAGKLTNVGTANTPAGMCAEAKAEAGTTAKVLLCPQPQRAAVVAYSAGSNLVGVDGAGSNAAPLAGTETRLDAIDTAIAAMLVALKEAGLMKNA